MRSTKSRAICQRTSAAVASALDLATAGRPRALKRLKLEALRAALESLGRSTEGTKPTLVERLIEARRAAASGAAAAAAAADSGDEQDMMMKLYLAASDDEGDSPENDN